METDCKQILLIENDPHMARSVPRRLKLAGYDVIVAQTMEEAQRALAQELFQIAIIDIRVDDDRSDTDTSGFTLARQLPPTIPCLFHTAHDTKENIRQALGPLGAEDIIAKDDPEGPGKLLARVDELFRTSVGVNFDLTIDSSMTLETIAHQLALSGDHADPRLNQQTDSNSQFPLLDKLGGASGPAPQARDISLVLRRLFCEGTTVRLTPLLSSETAGLHSQSGATLFKAQERRLQGSTAPVVLKLGDKAQIAEEAARYRASRPYIGGQRVAQLEGEAYSRSVGGLVYSLIGAQEVGGIHTLSEVLLTQETEVVINLLSRFFQQTFGQIYADAQPTRLDLMQHYTTHLDLSATKLQERVRAMEPTLLTAPTLQWDGLPRPLPNPLLFVIQNDAFRSFGEMETRTSLCHGDLHTRNILVDGEQHFWLIDFARSTASHILRDFAELETDIKFQVLPRQPLADFYAFESALTAPVCWEEEPSAILLPTPLQQAFDIIASLRRLACTLLELTGNMGEYYEALFWHTLNVVRFKAIAKERKRQALLSAALVLEQISKSHLTK